MSNKEVKYVDEYINNSWFGLFEAKKDYIIYKSKVSIHTTEQHPNLKSTVDILLVNTMYFEFLPDLYGVEINKASDKKSIELAKKYDKGFDYLESDERVYKITSGEFTHNPKPANSYLVTAAIWIYEHNCQNYVSFFDGDNYFDKVAKTIKLN